LGGVVTGVLGGGDNTPSSPATPTTSILPPVSITPTPSGPSDSASGSGSSTPVETPPPPPPGSTSGSGPGSTSDTTPNNSNSNGGGILDPVTSILGGATMPTDVSPSSLPPTDSLSNPGSISSTLSGPSGPTISFPTPTGNISTISSTYVESSLASETTITSTATTTFSVDPNLSFVLTESSLVFATVSTPSATLTDPDAATTTVEPIPVQAGSSAIVPAPLPSGIPARIFPRDQLDLTSNDLDGYTLISILFNSELNWCFVVQSDFTSSQIFAYVPVLITTALNISRDQIKPYALQVYIPTTYHSPADQAVLGSTWLGYIPTDTVDSLAAQIKVRSSPFYTGVPDGVAKELAQRVVPGFSIRSVADPHKDPSGSGNSNNGSSSGNSDSGRSRQDAIIGVVSALGAIALFVLVFLIYRSMQRRKQLAHRRLSDPPDESLGVRPPGREFDQDSVGGQRRRSFYYAEDSLRVYEGQANAHDQLMNDQSPATLSQRRNVVPTTISAPVLQGSTMNW
ncbi:hypothetical protein AN958_05723, partial [Leucoagaricus sp. SymC.cos]